MVSGLLITLFALATVATAFVLTDTGLRWCSAFKLLRHRMKQGYAGAGMGQRPAVVTGGANRFGRQARPCPVIGQVTRRAA